jgi:hypothetical protein
MFLKKLAISNEMECSFEFEDDYQREEESDYREISNLLVFLKNNLEDLKHNSKQLKVLKSSLKEVILYKKSIEDLETVKVIPRTWKDLDKYNMFV